MTQVKVQKVTTAKDRELPVFGEIERMLDRVRQRAFELSAIRGFEPGRALDDWLLAEKEICWPAAELSENDKEFALSVALPGFAATEIVVTATPRELIVQARTEATRKEQAPQENIRWTEFRSNDVQRRIELDREVDPAKCTATFRDGMLRVTAPKVAEVQPRKPVVVPVAA